MLLLRFALIFELCIVAFVNDHLLSIELGKYRLELCSIIPSYWYWLS